MIGRNWDIFGRKPAIREKQQAGSTDNQLV
jgi:hypothetical protein